MIINKWGSYGWIFFHAIAYQWEGEWFEEKVGIKFFENIGKFLPCPGCIAHYDKNYKNLEMSLIDAVKNKLSLGKWLVMLHNSVSKWQNNDSYTMKFLKYKKPMINDIQAKDMHKNTDWLVCWWYFMFAIAGTYRDSIPPAYEKLITLKTFKERKKYINTLNTLNIKGNLKYWFIDHPANIMFEMSKDQQLKFVERLKNIPSYKKFIVYCNKIITDTIDFTTFYNNIIKGLFRNKDDTIKLQQLLTSMAYILPGKNERKVYSSFINQEDIVTASLNKQNFLIWIHKLREVMIEKCAMNIVKPKNSLDITNNKHINILNNFYYRNLRIDFGKSREFQSIWNTIYTKK